jgi:hypothetical protein
LRSGLLSLDETGRYVVVFANCNDGGREIMVTGMALWESKHGRLPGELFEFMHFYTALWACYVILLVWFGMLMKKNAASQIDIERWIVLTIIMGLAEVTVREIDYRIWNWSGFRIDFLSYLGILLSTLKHGISRALIVMVSLGWGVIRDSLGSTMKKIVVLAAVYVAFAAAHDLVVLFAVEDMQTLSYNEEIKLFDTATILAYFVPAVNIIFILWVLDVRINKWRTELD